MVLRAVSLLITEMDSAPANPFAIRERPRKDMKPRVVQTGATTVSATRLVGGRVADKLGKV